MCIVYSMQNPYRHKHGKLGAEFEIKLVDEKYYKALIANSATQRGANANSLPDQSIRPDQSRERERTPLIDTLEQRLTVNTLTNSCTDTVVQ